MLRSFKPNDIHICSGHSSPRTGRTRPTAAAARSNTWPTAPRRTRKTSTKSRSCRARCRAMLNIYLYIYIILYIYIYIYISPYRILGQVSSMDTAVAKQKEEAKAAAAKQKAEKKAAVLRKKYEQAMAAAQLKLDAATKAWENNKKILDDSETDAKTLKKTQAGL